MYICIYVFGKLCVRHTQMQYADVVVYLYFSARLFFRMYVYAYRHTY